MQTVGGVWGAPSGCKSEKTEPVWPSRGDSTDWTVTQAPPAHDLPQAFLESRGGDPSLHRPKLATPALTLFRTTFLPQ